MFMFIVIFLDCSGNMSRDLSTKLFAITIFNDFSRSLRLSNDFAEIWLKVFLGNFFGPIPQKAAIFKKNLDFLKFGKKGAFSELF